MRGSALDKSQIAFVAGVFAFCGLCFWALLIGEGAGPRFAEIALLMLLLMVAAYSDYHRYIIPNDVVLAGIVLRMAFLVVYADGSFAGYVALLAGSVLNGLSLSLSIAIFAFVASRARGRSVLGGGDVKILFMCGMFFGLFENLAALLLACFAASIAGLILCVRNRRTLSEQVIPFGVPLAFSYCAMASAGGLLAAPAA